ncbi:hypothetical protein MKW94_020427 [Papaver nudicaule]|uniref:B-like cyclin n=1 Tax=Papaver nudicaule TaxID=74823 RepID=A0AA41W1U0_PAPNU|nr:hypothetical protein [Papaver nudicaule]
MDPSLEQPDSASFLHYNNLDALYCQEEQEVEPELEDNISSTKNGFLLLMEQDMYWENDELVSLLSKEKEIISTYQNNLLSKLQSDPNLAQARKESIQWMLKVNSYYSFSPLTALLSVNFLDRFLSSNCFHFQNDKLWMIQLISVACITLAAKVEETQVPALLDFQVEGTKYVFESRTIQRMELVILSSLHWKMNPVTPLSFLDHVIRRLGLKSNLHWEFMQKCQLLLLSIISDSRFVWYLPSVLAAATMLHVINRIEPCNAKEYHDQLMGVLQIDKDKVDECYELILECATPPSECKRKYESVPGSPNGVMDANFSSDSSNDSWPGVTESVAEAPPPRTLFKKRRVQIQHLRLPSINRVAVELLTSPRLVTSPR